MVRIRYVDNQTLLVASRELGTVVRGQVNDPHNTDLLIIFKFVRSTF